MKTKSTKLEAGRVYDPSAILWVGWTQGDGTGHEGYNVADYFRDGVYLGPDEHGIEPIGHQINQGDV